jgi:hypothetical protein
MSVLNIDSDFARTVEVGLTPPVLDGLQRAAQLLDQALPLVREAMNIVEPVQEYHQGIGRAIYEAGGRVGDEVYDAMRSRTGFGRAVDATFEILNEVKRVAY